MKNPLFQNGARFRLDSSARAESLHSRKSFALVIVLVFTVLLTAVVLAFLSNALLLRQVSNSSANQTKVNLFAQGALDTIVGDLKQEIADGSTAYTSNNILIYIPKVTDNAGLNRHKSATVVPGYQGFTPTLNASFVETDGLNNLLKVSCTKPFYTNTFFTSTTVVSGITRGSSAYTTNSSQNGRFISLKRWNKPLLLTQKNTASKTDFTPVTAFPTPTWILVARNGSNPTAWNNNLRTSSAVATTVVGRYAYAIYDEAGLLDTTVAGFPTGVSTDFTSRRGLLPQVDISAIPGILDENSLVLWRNQVSAASAASYTNYVLTATNGFTAVTSGDQTFVSRQALIQYVNDHPTQITPQALQYLGTFSRELNAPSYSPPDGGTPARPKTLAGQGYRTAPDPGDMDDQFNPSLINTRVTTSFVRSDGTQAAVGEPLIKNRFPLSRLKWIGYAGPNGATAAQIYNSFGLTYSNGVWTYNHGVAGQIQKLSDVAAGTYGPARDPDFFELLQAGIFAGSLAKSGPTTSAGLQTGSNTLIFDSNSYYQIIQIGANLVDQYNTDSYPRRISFDGQEFDGVEDLPYLEKVFKAVYRYNGTNQPANHPLIGLWYVPFIWNPHADAATHFSSPSYIGPTQFRFVTVGSAYVVCSEVDPSFATFDPTTMVESPITTFPDPPPASVGLKFSASAAFVQPTALTPSNCTATGNDLVSDPGTTTSFCGICVAIFKAPDQYVDPSDPTATMAFNFATDFQNPSVTHELQYKDQSGNWITYSQLKNVENQYPDWLNYDNQGQTYNPTVYYIRSGCDPRTDRFGSSFGNTEQNAPLGGASYTPASGIWSTDTFRPSATSPEYRVYMDTSSGAALGWYQYGSGGWLGMLSENKVIPTDPTPVSMHYTDPDGQLRGADGAYVNDTVVSNDILNNTPSNGGTPLATDQGTINAATPFGSYNSRPVILNRPFRSVAEMGYAFRDTAWKHLDCFTIQSADAALLDLFCLNESPSIVAGKIDLNTRQLPVIQTVLAGAIKSDPDATVIGSVEAANLATNFFAAFKNPALTGAAATGLNDSLTDPNTSTSVSIAGPLLNRSQLVTRWNTTLSTTTTTPYASLTDSTIKRRREAVIRALADVGNTRTWNLLIDVVAQTGRYGATATTLDQFTVEGECRLWLHVAIDRYTGKIISQYVEPVYE